MHFAKGLVYNSCERVYSAFTTAERSLKAKEMGLNRLTFGAIGYDNGEVGGNYHFTVYKQGKVSFGV